MPTNERPVPVVFHSKKLTTSENSSGPAKKKVKPMRFGERKARPLRVCSSAAEVPKWTATRRCHMKRVAAPEHTATARVPRVSGWVMRSPIIESMPLGSATITNHTEARATRPQPARRRPFGPAASGFFASSWPATSTHSRPTTITMNGRKALLRPVPNLPMPVNAPSWCSSAEPATTKRR